MVACNGVIALDVIVVFPFQFAIEPTIAQVGPCLILELVPQDQILALTLWQRRRAGPVQVRRGESLGGSKVEILHAELFFGELAEVL